MADELHQLHTAFLVPICTAPTTAGSCIDAGYTECCSGQNNTCLGVSADDTCFCDDSCFDIGDCCSDIGELTCAALGQSVNDFVIITNARTTE